MHVLVAEDSDVLRLMIEKIITNENHSVTLARDGQEAVELFQNSLVQKEHGQQIDLIIMDAEMPQKDGIEATGEIRARSGEDWIPIIFLSGHTEDDYIQRALDNGADVYLRKPINTVELIGQIRAMRRIVDMKAKLDELNSQLHYLANYDGLTQIANRRVFNERLEYDLKKIFRTKTPLSLILCDIDYFKLYNDTYGHLAGDNCLKKVAKTLQRTFKRDTDLVARYGGEEFAIIMPATPQDEALSVVEQMLDNVRALDITHKASKITSHITMSVGLISSNGEVNYTPENFIQMADKALYHAKENGRNQVSVAS